MRIKESWRVLSLCQLFPLSRDVTTVESLTLPLLCDNPTSLISVPNSLKSGAFRPTVISALNMEWLAGEDIDYVLEVLPPIVDRLRQMSPLYAKFTEASKGGK